MSTIVVARGISLNRTRSSISWSRALVLEVAYCVGPKANMLAEFFFPLLFISHTLPFAIHPSNAIGSRCGPPCLSQSTRGVYVVIR
jgi:hypothetical protein